MSSSIEGFDFSELAFALGQPHCMADLKQHPEDFVVEEQIAYDLSGEGEHLWVWVEKRGENSDWLAQQLADWAGVPKKNVGYAGKKDRHAVTRQWMSLYLPGQADPELATFTHPNAKILHATRHAKKLQTGGLSGNRFEICLRNLSGKPDDLISRCQQVAQTGVPNYFGEQRFGRELNNLDKASQLFSGQLKRVKRNEKGLYLSAARSWVFNQILSQRIEKGCWHQRLAGDVYMLSGSSRCFAEEVEITPVEIAEIERRLSELDIHPTGLMTGRGHYFTQGAAQALEDAVVSDFKVWQMGLEQAGMKQERRALRVLPKNFEYVLEENQLRVTFELPAGSYATMVLRELLNVR